MDIIKAEMRAPAAKARQLRRSGIIPCVISGADLDRSLSIQIDQLTATRLKRTKRDGSKVDIQVGDKLYHTLIKDLEYSNLSDEVIHISFLVLGHGKKVNSVADIVLLNKDKVPGVLEQMQLRVPHAAEPEDLLDVVTVDLTDVAVGAILTVGDIPEFQNERIELQIDPGSIVFRVRDKNRASEAPADANTEAQE